MSITTTDNTSTTTTAPPPRITLYFLQCSRSIRIAWLLEELGLPYEVKSYERDKQSLGGVGIAASEKFERDSRGSMGKAPVLVDGNLVVQESGAITEYVPPFFLFLFLFFSSSLW